MTKVKIEIEIPDGHEVDSIRQTSVCESGSSGIFEFGYFVYTRQAKPFLINDVPSVWPKLLTCDYVAADKNGQIFGYNGKPPHPYRGTGKWQAEGEGEFGQIFGTAIVIPGPWEESLQKNPKK